MKIAIIGSTGFIGKYLAKSWNHEKDELRFFNSKNPIWEKGGVLTQYFAECDLFIWTAGYANPSSAAKSNYIGKIETRELLRAAQSLNIIGKKFPKRFIFLSSAGCTYTGSSSPYIEGDEALGTNAYGRMKLAQESILSSHIENLAIIRLANVFGTGQPIGKGQGVIAEWFAAIEKGTNPVIYGEIENYRDYIHVLDSVSAIEMVAKSQEIGILNVGSGIATSLEQLKEYFTKIVRVELNFDSDQTRKTDRAGYYLSISKITNSLAWKPKIELKDGIEMIYRDSKVSRE